MRSGLAIAAVFLVGGAATAQPSSVAGTNVSPAASPAATVVDSFHRALGLGDTKAALGFLDDNALIFESGGAERSRAEYAEHHLAADAAFSKAVPSKLMRRSGDVTGDIAWIASEGRTTGTYKGKAVDRLTTETMILRRARDEWKIVHIHWSSVAGGR
jgi:ketosteroid isomerase-like protein